MKSVKVSDSVWEELTLLKIKLKVKSYDEVVKYLLSNVVKTEAMKSVATESVTAVPESVKSEELKEELVSASYVEEYVKSELVPKLKKHVYAGSKTKLVWGLNEFRQLIESLTNLPVNDVLEALVDAGFVEVVGNQVVLKLK